MNGNYNTTAVREVRAPVRGFVDYMRELAVLSLMALVLIAALAALIVLPGMKNDIVSETGAQGQVVLTSVLAEE